MTTSTPMDARGAAATAASRNETIALDDATKPQNAKQKSSKLVMLRNKKSLTGICILGFFVLIGIIGPWLPVQDPSGRDKTANLAPPSLHHWFGTTSMGQDVFAQLVIGTRGILIVGFSAGLIATALAILVGVSAGYFGGMRDEGLSMLSNVFLVIPQIPLMIVIVSMVQSNSKLVVILVIALTGWAWGARVMRSQTLSMASRDFVQAAKANGESSIRIIVFEIMPNLIAIIASTFINTVMAAVMAEITLAFVGIVPLSDWNWGLILYYAQSNGALNQGAWWWFIPAGLCVALLGMSLALINFGIDEFINPRLRNVGMNAARLRRMRVRPRVGFTPVVRPMVRKAR